MLVLLQHGNCSCHINAALGYKTILSTKTLNQTYNRISIHSLNPKAFPYSIWASVTELCKWVRKQGKKWPKQTQSCPLYSLVSCASHVALSCNINTPLLCSRKMKTHTHTLSSQASSWFHSRSKILKKSTLLEDSEFVNKQKVLHASILTLLEY